MKCFARWEMDEHSGVFFRDQTILQFGDNWNLLASFVLLNPGSALPVNDLDITDFLRSKNLPFFVEPFGKEMYLEFSTDRLMHDLLKLFSAHFSGGCVRLYNLFNLKNQHSNIAIGQISSNQTHPKMFARSEDIKFCDSPVIIASGANAGRQPLKNELIKYVSLARTDNLYSLSRNANNQFSISKSEPDKEGFIASYHPSYTFKYGNMTSIGNLLSQELTK